MRTFFKIASIVLIVVLLLSFDHSEVAKHDYFPLQKGNQWTYCIPNNEDGSTYRYSTSIIGDTNINSKEYFIIKDVYDDTGIIQVQYYRLENGNIFLRESQNSKEYLYFPSVDSLNKTYNVFENDFEFKNTIVSLFDSIKTPAGKFDSLVNFSVLNLSIGQHINYYFSRKYGLVATRINSRPYSYLESCILDGKIYKLKN